MQARLEVTQPLTPLRALLRSADSWFLLTAAGTGVTALLLAVWVSSRISGPLAALAEKTAVLDLDRLDVDFDAGTDEVGTIVAAARRPGGTAAHQHRPRARGRTARDRRRAGPPDQPRHQERPDPASERDAPSGAGRTGRAGAPCRRCSPSGGTTVDSSIAYLETLATSYQRLSPPLDRRECDLNALITDVVRAAQGHEHVEFETDLTNLPRVVGDPVAFRRILENLIANAVDSLQSKPGRITVSTQVVDRDGEPAGDPGDGRRHRSRNVG